MARKMPLGLGFLLLCLLHSTNLLPEEVSFIARKDYFVGLRPFSVVTADFNHDGHLDLATTNYVSNSISILLGDGNGRFERIDDIPVGLNPVEIAVGDFNGDEKLDLAVANSGSRDISVLLGDGEGGFSQLGTNFPVDRSPRSIAAGDFNNDGILDLAIGVQNGVSFLLGDGRGSFSEIRNFDLENTGPACLKVGDFNGDGNLDLVAANPTGRIPLLFGDGTGGFTVEFLSLPCSGLCIGRVAVCLTVEDFNNDEKLDLAIAEGGRVGPQPLRAVSIWYGDGNGNFTESERQPLNPNLYSPVFITTADLNNDAVLDLVLANQPGQFVSVLLRDGQGGFTFGRELNFASGLAPNSIAIGDFNGDGNQDLAVANPGGPNTPDKTVSIFLGNGEGGFINERRIGPGGLAVVKGDFNNDGNLDLATSIPNAIFIALGDGQGNFGEPRRFEASAASLAAGDFNNDGNLDLATVGSIYLGDGKGNIIHAADLPLGPSPSYIIAEDFNRDGNLDLAVVNRRDQFDWQRRIPGTVSILLGDGKLNFSRQDFEVGVAPISIVAGDFNNDGNIDLAVGNVDPFGPSSTISIMLGDGHGSFERAREFNITPYPIFMAVGDFNKDGNLDLAVSLGQAASTEISVLFGDGKGGFSEPRNFEVGITPRAIVAGDFNGDDNLDLAVAGMNTNSVSILLGDGKGGFNDQIRFGTGVFPFGMVEGDFNNDGKLDLVTANVRDRLSVLINDTTSSKAKNSDDYSVSLADASPNQLTKAKSTSPNSGASRNLWAKTFRLLSFLANGEFFKPLIRAFK